MISSSSLDHQVPFSVIDEKKKWYYPFRHCYHSYWKSHKDFSSLYSTQLSSLSHEWHHFWQVDSHFCLWTWEHRELAANIVTHLCQMKDRVNVCGYNCSHQITPPCHNTFKTADRDMLTVPNNLSWYALINSWYPLSKNNFLCVLYIYSLILRINRKRREGFCTLKEYWKKQQHRITPRAFSLNGMGPWP